ncbi:MAG: signal peptidase I [Campylobacterales bacterium]|nr:signal peptidase I [Campylobacterales bacterium]
MRNILSKFYHFAGTWTGTIIIVLFLIFFVAQSFVIPSGSMKNTLLIGDFLFAKKYSYGIPTPHLPWLEIPVVPDFNDNGHLIEGSRPKRGDIVIFRKPDAPKVHFVKRCVAVGGDEIIYGDKKLLIHFHEGDQYIQKNYASKKIVRLLGKLWVQNPYKDTFPGIHYMNTKRLTSFEQLIVMYPDIDMKPLLLEEFDSKISDMDGGINAFYKKVEPDHFYMIGDNRDNSNDSRFWGSVPYKYIVGKPWAIYFSIEHRSYDYVLNGADSQRNGSDIDALQRVCKKIDIYSNECKTLWDKERFRIRWNRIGNIIDTMQYEEPSL